MSEKTDLQREILAAIRKHEGDGHDSTGATLEDIMHEVDARDDKVEEELHDALMSGFCYQPDGEHYRAI